VLFVDNSVSTQALSRWKTRRDAINGKARVLASALCHFGLWLCGMLLCPTVAPACQASRTFSEARSKRGRNKTLSPTGIVRPTLSTNGRPSCHRGSLYPLIPLLAPSLPLRYLDSAVKNGESVLKLSQVSTETASPSTM
jgi:hypothetical protein